VGQKVRKAGIGRKSFLRKEGKKRLFVQKIGIINKLKRGEKQKE
jgi:hypothetical protein